MLSGEATNTNFIVLGLTQLGLKPMIYHTRGEHTNNYTIDAVKKYFGASKTKGVNKNAKIGEQTGCSITKYDLLQGDLEKWVNYLFWHVF